MRTIFILLLACFFVSCDGVDDAKKLVNDTGVRYNVVVIDSCEYIRSIQYGISYYSYAHKGNCKFCQQRKCK